jgi:hypothetical protein
VSNLLEQSDLVVKHRPKLLERRVGYDIFDERGAPVGSVVQIGRDNLEKTLRPSRADNAQTSFEMSDASGAVVLLLTYRQALKSSLVVAHPDGSEIGRIRLENLIGASRFTLDLAGANVGAMTATSWRKRNFVIVDGAANEIARIDMTHGSSGDHAHHNEYAVHVHGRPADPFRSFTLAAAIAVDMILWER